MPALLKQRSREDYKELLCDLLPDQGNWTEEGYLWLTDHTNRMIEFSAGYLEALPMPTDKHQTVVKLLFILFNAVIKRTGGTVHFSGLRLRLPSGLFREPDLLALLDAHDSRRQNRFWTGADLVAEVVSEDDPQRDLVQKRREYAQAGIPEYWIVNPLDETIIVYRLSGKRYVRHGLFRRGQHAASALLDDLRIEVDQVFDAD